MTSQQSGIEIVQSCNGKAEDPRMGAEVLEFGLCGREGVKRRVEKYR